MEQPRALFDIIKFPSGKELPRGILKMFASASESIEALSTCRENVDCYKFHY